MFDSSRPVNAARPSCRDGQAPYPGGQNGGFRAGPNHLRTKVINSKAHTNPHMRKSGPRDRHQHTAAIAVRLFPLCGYANVRALSINANPTLIGTCQHRGNLPGPYISLGSNAYLLVLCDSALFPIRTYRRPMSFQTSVSLAPGRS
jgi:hypothetical protein